MILIPQTIRAVLAVLVMLAMLAELVVVVTLTAPFALGSHAPASWEASSHVSSATRASRYCWRMSGCFLLSRYRHSVRSTLQRVAPHPPWRTVYGLVPATSGQEGARCNTAKTL